MEHRADDTDTNVVPSPAKRPLGRPRGVSNAASSTATERGNDCPTATKRQRGWPSKDSVVNSLFDAVAQSNADAREQGRAGTSLDIAAYVSCNTEDESDPMEGCSVAAGTQEERDDIDEVDTQASLTTIITSALARAEDLENALKEKRNIAARERVRVERLKSDAEAANARVIGLVDQLTECKISRQKERQASQAAAVALEKDLAERTKAIERLETELERLKKKLEIQKEDADKARVAVAAANSELEKQLAEESEKAASESQRAEALAKELNAMKDEADRATEIHQEESRVFAATVEELKKELDSSKKSAAEGREKLETLESAATEERKIQEALKGELSASKKNVSKLESALESANKQTIDAQERADKLRKKIDEEAERHKEAIFASDVAVALFKEEFERAITTEQSKVMALEAEVAAERTGRVTAEKMLLKLADSERLRSKELEAEVASSKEATSSAQAMTIDTVANAVRQKREHEERVGVLQRELVECKKAMEELRAKGDEKTTQLLRKEVAEYRNAAQMELYRSQQTNQVASVFHAELGFERQRVEHLRQMLNNSSIALESERQRAEANRKMAEQMQNKLGEAHKALERARMVVAELETKVASNATGTEPPSAAELAAKNDSAISEELKAVKSKLDFERQWAGQLTSKLAASIVALENERKARKREAEASEEAIMRLRGEMFAAREGSKNAEESGAFPSQVADLLRINSMERKEAVVNDRVSERGSVLDFGRPSSRAGSSSIPDILSNATVDIE